MKTDRTSRIAYVIIRLRVEGKPCLLLRANQKWNDWSLVGGHVEAGEEADWSITARREAEEELAPLLSGEDFEIHPLPGLPTSFGPEPSRSAGGAMTRYEVAWFYLTFVSEPALALSRLPTQSFLLVSDDCAKGQHLSPDITELVARVHQWLPGGLDSVPYAWPNGTPSPQILVRECGSASGRQ